MLFKNILNIFTLDVEIKTSAIFVMADNILCLIQLNKRAVDSLLSLCYTRRYPFSDCSYKRRKKTYMPIYFQEKTSWKLNERLIVIETFSIKSADTFSHLKWLWRLLLRIPCKQTLIRGKLIKKENTTRQDTLNNFNSSYLKDSTMAS